MRRDVSDNLQEQLAHAAEYLLNMALREEAAVYERAAEGDYEALCEVFVEDWQREDFTDGTHTKASLLAYCELEAHYQDHEGIIRDWEPTEADLDFAADHLPTAAIQGVLAQLAEGDTA